jgi:hypothetical protein
MSRTKHPLTAAEALLRIREIEREPLRLFVPSRKQPGARTFGGFGGTRFQWCLRMSCVHLPPGTVVARTGLDTGRRYAMLAYPDCAKLLAGEVSAAGGSRCEWTQMKNITKVETKTFTTLWVRVEFQKNTEEFRRIRAKFVYKGRECFNCQHEFAEDEMMALACFRECGNKMLCQSCAKELQS